MDIDKIQIGQVIRCRDYPGGPYPHDLFVVDRISKNVWFHPVGSNPGDHILGVAAKCIEAVNYFEEINAMMQAAIAAGSMGDFPEMGDILTFTLAMVEAINYEGEPLPLPAVIDPGFVRLPKLPKAPGDFHWIGKMAEPCVVCGRNVIVGVPHPRLHVVNGGEYAASEPGVDLFDPALDSGWLAVGPGCLTAFPELIPFAVMFPPRVHCEKCNGDHFDGQCPRGGE